MPPPAVPCTFSSFNFSCSSFIFFCIFCICFIICCIFPPPRIYLSSLKTSISSDCNSSFVSLYMPFNSLSCITLHHLHLLCFLQIGLSPFERRRLLQETLLSLFCFLPHSYFVCGFEDILFLLSSTDLLARPLL